MNKKTEKVTKKELKKNAVDLFNQEAEDTRIRSLDGMGNGIMNTTGEGTRGIGEGTKRRKGHAITKSKGAGRAKSGTPKDNKFKTNYPRGLEE